MSYLYILQQNASPSCGCGTYTYNLEAVPGGDGNYLAESVTAYEKAKTEIENTYSSDSISQRAKSQGITDIDAYTKQQQTSKSAELQKLNLDYTQKTGSNIMTQANGLNKFFNYSNWDGDSNSHDNSFNNLVKDTFDNGYTNIYSIKLQDIFNSFEKHFLN
ncbi:hypothetical protein CUB90_00235 [Clostridium sp. CT7]|nr:hypothetical protein CUB90_00235 [Clostridium sp. CT7]